MVFLRDDQFYNSRRKDAKKMCNVSTKNMRDYAGEMPVKWLCLSSRTCKDVCFISSMLNPIYPGECTVRSQHVPSGL